MNHRYEKFGLLFAMGLLLTMTALDLIEDFQAGDGLTELGLDLIIVGSTGALLIYVYIFEPMKTRAANRQLAAVSDAQAEDLERLSQIAQKQLAGLGAYIKAQFIAWHLTEAEQEVALMLLKGLSMKEIAELRQVSERTTRQQATTIYGKSGTTGRTGLSAFFLEDLLLPSTQS